MNSASRRHALLIGTENHHDPRLERLSSTRVDTAQLAAVLENRQIGAFDVTVKSDLTSAAMRAAIHDFCQERIEDDLALIYVSGHGARGPGGEFVFLSTDTDLDRIEETGVSAGTVNGWMEDCLARQKIAVFDTCDSGAFTLGFATRPAKSAAAAVPLRPAAPLTPSGVYVLASSDVAQKSFAGVGGTVAEPAPSVFTAALVDVLHGGAAGASSDGFVSVDDVFEAVARRLASADPPQTPVKSTLRVTGRIALAARPLGAASLAVDERTRAISTRPPEPTGTPGWAELLAYYAAMVQAEVGRPTFMPASGDEFVVVQGAERALSGVLDDEGAVPTPAGAEQLIERSREPNGPDLWMGWPAVVFAGDPNPRRQRGPVLAPLLMRRVEAVTDERGTRLLVEGNVVLHPALVDALLGPGEAATLTSSFFAEWRRGEYSKMAAQAANVLMDDLGLKLVHALRPEQLDDRIDLATPGDGARNAAVLFGIAPSGATQGLITDIEKIISRPTAISGTALAALFPRTSEPAPAPAPALVTPMAANPAQRAVLTSAMTRRLTVATGPPGTGKSQLVVNAVATAVAAGQTVLVASTNNQPVDEVHERCAQLAPGFVIRTGNTKKKVVETGGLQKLSGSQPPTPGVPIRKQAFRRADQQLTVVVDRIGNLAGHEASLLELARKRLLAEQAVGRPLAEIMSALPEGWGQRARSLERAWLFGEWRRRRFLQPGGFPMEETASTCGLLADLAEADERWRDAVGGTGPTPLDAAALQHDLDVMTTAQGRASTDLIRGVMAERAVAGQNQIHALMRAKEDGRRDWQELSRALPFVPAWAVTSLSARRFPINPDKPPEFDLVIIDEASQCTIPSIVPLLFRAKRALVIGDPMQLAHISTVDAGTDDVLRARFAVPQPWLAEYRLSPRRHSAFAAAERIVGTPLLLDEHYRCHPDIAGIVNRLFYGGRLAVLTDLAANNRVRVDGPPVVWQDVAGRAERGPNGRSWRNPDEVAEVARCVDELISTLPTTATIGVVTPYRPQADDLERRLRSYMDGDQRRVRVGTAHKFQGGERDVMVFSLVADRYQNPRDFDWADRQQDLWNVAITRARSQLVVVGDGKVWDERGEVGSELRQAAQQAAAATPPLDDELIDRLYDALITVPGISLELDVPVNGHRADAVLTHRGGSRAILVDRGPATGVDPATHLQRMMRRRALLGADAVRLPAWMLFDEPARVRQWIEWPTS